MIPYFLLFVAGAQWMLAGLQVSYLIFGIHGLYLWWLEARRDAGLIRFNEAAWYAVTWVASLVIFVVTVAITDFHVNWGEWLGFGASFRMAEAGVWNSVQFVAVSLALIANFATTRKWAWSWGVWIAVNAVQAVCFFHLRLWAQFGLQFVLAGMSAYGWTQWRDEEARVKVPVSA